MVHISGIHNKAADAIFRHPSGHTNPEKLCLHDDIAHTQNVMAIKRMFLEGIRCHGTADWDDGITEISTYSLESLRSVTWDRVREATASGEDTHILVSPIENCMPQFRHELYHALRAFHLFREHLHTSDGVIIYKDIVVIPTSLQQDILSALHSAHQGTTSMMARAEASVFWSGITTAINAIRANCEHCNRMAPSQPSAPPTPPAIPVDPFSVSALTYSDTRGWHTSSSSTDTLTGQLWREPLVGRIA